MHSHILIPTDGSSLSTVTLEQSIELARDANAKATILTVVEPFRIFSTDAAQLAGTRDTYERIAKDEAARYLADADMKARAIGVACETVMVESDHPYRAIIDIADQKGCDLIAMASHGRSGVAALVLGSETLKVLTHSTIPVLVYRQKVTSE